jgi:WD40 repeat protein
VAERDAKVKALDRAEGLRLSAEAAAARHQDPALGLLLALEATRRVPNRITYNVVYDAMADLREVRTLTPEFDDYFQKRFPDPTIVAAALSPDGKVIAAATVNGTLHVWDASTGRAVAFNRGVGLNVTRIVFHPNGRRFLTLHKGYAYVGRRDGRDYVYTDRLARLWDATTGKAILDLRGHTDRVISAEFSPDGSRILTAGWDCAARVFDAETGAQKASFSLPKQTPLLARFAPDGKSATYIVSNRTSVSDIAHEALKDASLIDPQIRREVEIEPYGTGGHGDMQFFFGGTPTVARLFDTTTGREVASLTKSPPGLFQFGHVWHPSCAAFSADGSKVAIGFEEDAAAVWDGSKDWRESVVLKGQKGKRIGLAFGRPGELLTTTTDGLATAWNIATGQMTTSSSTLSDAMSVGFDADATRVAVASADRAVTVWQVSPFISQATLKGHTGPVIAAAVAPGGGRAMTAGDKTVRIWDTRPFADPAIVLKGHTGAIKSLSYDPAGRRVLTSAPDGTARLWDAETGRALRTIGKDSALGEVRSARFRPDGHRIVTSSSNTRTRIGGKDVNVSAVHVWDAATGAELLALGEHEQGARDAWFLGDGENLLTLADGSITINLSGGQPGTGGSFNVSKSGTRQDGTLAPGTPAPAPWARRSQGPPRARWRRPSAPTDVGSPEFSDLSTTSTWPTPYPARRSPF